MHRIIALFAVAAAAVAAVAATGCSRAEAIESFTLDEHDHLIAEAPGCYASCQIQGTRRFCTIREYDCKAVCQVIPECRPAGAAFPVKVCAVVKTRAF